MTKLELALALAARGFKVFPIQQHAKFPPLVKDWPALANSDPHTIGTWWKQWPSANIGIHCDGLAVVDVDVAKGGAESLQGLDMTYGLPPTLTTITPTGGKHLFYRLPEGHPGVKNSVGELGDGLDVRSRGGYVVAPGSELPRGRYRFEADLPIADAPEWLLEKLGVAVEAQRHEIRDVPDAEDSVVERAYAWLVHAPRSVKGEGGDQTAYKVACRLRDLGVSYQQACELMRSEAWDHGCGWRTGRLEEKPIRSAYRYAQEDAPGKLALTNDDFSTPSQVSPAGSEEVVSTDVQKIDVSTERVQAPDVNRATGPQPLSAFASGAEGTRYLIKGVLSERSYAVIYGIRSAGKTFVGLDMAYCIAAGKEWMGLRVHQAPVLYLPYEGAGGLRKRAEALRRHYGTAEVPFYVDDSRYNLREPEGRRALSKAIATLPAVPKLIILDTFAHALMGGDENSAQDVGAFNSAVMGLIKATGACVMVLHHPAKSGNGGPRGSSALPGAIDIELEVADRSIRSTKQRDFDLGEPIGFALKPIIVGMDEDGEDITSCVVLPAKVTAGGNDRVVKHLRGKAKLVWEKMVELRPDNSPITDAELREGCAEFLGNRKAAFYEAISRIRQLIIKDEEGMYRRKME